MKEVIKRAGELFAVLTSGSFQTLQLEFDEDDHVELAGIRQDGRRVAVAGMSEGTMDQLYLALRVAAIEDYLDHAEPMPFIADDLLCAGHAQQLGGESLLPNLMEVKG
jgi:uncharacterized protein YhaN